MIQRHKKFTLQEILFQKLFYLHLKIEFPWCLKEVSRQVVGHQVRVRWVCQLRCLQGFLRSSRGQYSVTQHQYSLAMRPHLPSLWVDPKFNRNHLKMQQIAFSLIILPSQPHPRLFHLFGLNTQIIIETHRTRKGNDPHPSPVDLPLTVYNWF